MNITEKDVGSIHHESYVLYVRGSHVLQDNGIYSGKEQYLLLRFLLPMNSKESWIRAWNQIVD